MRLTYWNDRKGSFDWICDNNEIANKLAAYEDTMLEPEEIKLNMDGLDEYHKAEAEGRLVILPCTVGDTAYIIWDSNIYPENPPAVREDHITQLKFTTKGYAFKTWRGWYHKSDIGKTVFLTREEAEAALKSKNK